MIVEVPPSDGTLVAFKRSDNSWHGHKPFSGKRRVGFDVLRLAFAQ